MKNATPPKFLLHVARYLNGRLASDPDVKELSRKSRFIDGKKTDIFFAIFKLFVKSLRISKEKKLNKTSYRVKAHPNLTTHLTKPSGKTTGRFNFH